MKQTSGYLLASIFVLVVGIYSILSIHKVAQPFIEMAISSAEATKALLENEQNIIRSITAEQRQVWLANLSDPKLEATGITALRNIASYIIGILFFCYVCQLLAASYKSYNKSKQQDK